MSHLAALGRMLWKAKAILFSPPPMSENTRKVQGRQCFVSRVKGYHCQYQRLPKARAVRSRNQSKQREDQVPSLLFFLFPYFCSLCSRVSPLVALVKIACINRLQFQHRTRQRAQGTGFLFPDENLRFSSRGDFYRPCGLFDNIWRPNMSVMLMWKNPGQEMMCPAWDL